MAKSIERVSKHGMPNGVYEITYYRAERDGSVIRTDRDSDVSAAYAVRVASKLRAGEIAIAECRSQPGGVEAFGSERARQAWDAH